MFGLLDFEPLKAPLRRGFRWRCDVAAGFRPAGGYRCDGRNVPGQVVDDPSAEFPGSWRRISTGNFRQYQGFCRRIARQVSSPVPLLPLQLLRGPLMQTSQGRALFPALGSGLRHLACWKIQTCKDAAIRAELSTCDGSRRHSCAPEKVSVPWLPRQHQNVVVGYIGNHHGGFRCRVSPADGVADDFHHGRLKGFPAVGQAFDMRAFWTKFQDVVHGAPSI